MMASRTDPPHLVDRDGDGAAGGRPPFSIAQLGLLTVVAVALISGSVIDLPRELWPATRRGISALGMLTLALASMGTLALLGGRVLPTRAMRVLAPFAGMMLWAVASLGWAPTGRAGLQILAVLGCFLILAFVAAAAMVRDRHRTVSVLIWSMRAADVIGLGIVAANFLEYGWPAHIVAERWVGGPRSIALFGLVPLSWHLARWVRGNDGSAVLAVSWLMALVVTLSRTATAAAVLLVLLSGLLRMGQGDVSARRRFNNLMVLLVPVVLVAVFAVGPFRDRFMKAEVSITQPGEFQLNDGGRMKMWDSVARSAARSPFLGKGLGSSEEVVNEIHYWVGHPHNEFLRIWHDLGLPGILMFLLTLGTIGRFCWGHVSRPIIKGVAPPLLPLAASGVLISLIAGMMTDNPLVYIFVMAPSGIVIGAALGAEARQRKRRTRRDEIADPVGVTKADAAFTLNDDDVVDAVYGDENRARRRRRRRPP